MPNVMELEALDENHAVLVGGKAANLGRLSDIDGVSVPAGFCLTTGRLIASWPTAGRRSTVCSLGWGALRWLTGTPWRG